MQQHDKDLLDNDEYETEMIPVHYPYHYRFRGEELANMTQSEYYALVGIKRQTEDDLHGGHGGDDDDDDDHDHDDHDDNDDDHDHDDDHEMSDSDDVMFDGIDDSNPNASNAQDDSSTIARKDEKK
jgi:hypothetical protein